MYIDIENKEVYSIIDEKIFDIYQYEDSCYESLNLKDIEKRLKGRGLKKVNLRRHIEEVRKLRERIIEEDEKYLYEKFSSRMMLEVRDDSVLWFSVDIYPLKDAYMLFINSVINNAGRPDLVNIINQLPAGRIYTNLSDKGIIKVYIYDREKKMNKVIHTLKMGDTEKIYLYANKFSSLWNVYLQELELLKGGV